MLGRPDKLNSFTAEMWDELRTLGQELVADPGDLRALIVIGEGRAFSSGIDTSVFTTGSGLDVPDAGARDANPLVDMVMRTQESYSWLETAPFATIAAVRGYALGAGLQIALACDMRIFARGTSVGLLEFKYGIIPDLGGTQRLPRLVGPGKAKELIFTSARIDADEAFRIGLCEQLVSDEELDETAEKLAEKIAGAAAARDRRGEARRERRARRADRRRAPDRSRGPGDLPAVGRHEGSDRGICRAAAPDLPDRETRSSRSRH